MAILKEELKIFYSDKLNTTTINTGILSMDIAYINENMNKHLGITDYLHKGIDAFLDTPFFLLHNSSFIMRYILFQF